MEKFNLKQTLLCVAVLVLAIAFGGAHIASHVIFGILMFVGLIALVENVGWIKWIVYKSNVLLDLLFFGASIMATIYMGVTITGAITVASIIFSLVYAPMIRNTMKYEKLKEKVDKDKIRNDIRYKRW